MDLSHLPPLLDRPEAERQLRVERGEVVDSVPPQVDDEPLIFLRPAAYRAVAYLGFDDEEVAPHRRKYRVADKEADAPVEEEIEFIAVVHMKRHVGVALYTGLGVL